MTLKNLVHVQHPNELLENANKGITYCTEHKHVKEEQKKVAAGL